MADKQAAISKKIKNNLEKLTPQDFRNFGVEHIAYIRPVNIQDKDFFVVYSADGKKLHTTDSMDEAIQMARLNDLEPVTIH